jgi:hypothetical protein
MCVKIIGTEEVEFNPTESLEQQMMGAQEIIIDFDPLDEKIDYFVDKIEKMADTGIGCQANIVVNANNCINGMKLERKMEKIKQKLDVNEIIKGLCNFHAETDRKLCELSEMCLKENE